MDYNNIDAFEKLSHAFEKVKHERVCYYQRKICYGVPDVIKHDYDKAAGEFFNVLKEIMNVT